jgi:hypothetical protein
MVGFRGDDYHCESTVSGGLLLLSSMVILGVELMAEHEQTCKIDAG